MKSGNLIVENATIVTPVGSSARRGDEMSQLKIVEDGGVIIEDGVISYVGEMSAMPSVENSGFEKINADGRVVLPGFIDSHTHLIFGGYRPQEFEWRMRGDTYMSIMQRGGGIQSTVDATREESAESLAKKAQWFLDRMAEMGVSTVEAKSGYGLSCESESKMLDAIKMLAEDKDQKVRIVATFLGAHAVPKEYKDTPERYADLIIEEMIPDVKDKAEFFDIFTEKNVFEIDESRRMLNAAKSAGMKLKLHADEIVTLGGAELAAEVGAVSADHLLHVSEEGIKRMAEAGVVATLLPLTAFSLREQFAPARKFIDSGCAVALATDLNPGSCFSGSIPLTIALARIYMNMTVEETITALTLNGASALDLAAETGSIEEGKKGDLVMLEFADYSSLSYYVGMNCVNTTVCNGVITSQRDLNPSK